MLRPGGWLGLVWNVPKPAEDWELELAGLDPDRKGLDDGDDSEPEPHPSFPVAETETATFAWSWELTPDHWRAYQATNSGVAAMGEAEREQHLDRGRAVIARVCETTGRATVPLRHEAYCVRWQPSS